MMLEPTVDEYDDSSVLFLAESLDRETEWSAKMLSSPLRFLELPELELES